MYEANPVRGYQALALRRAMKLYIDTGLKANVMYTPANMLRTAGNLTGRSYPRGKQGMRTAMRDLTEKFNLPELRQ